MEPLAPKEDLRRQRIDERRHQWFDAFIRVEVAVVALRKAKGDVNVERDRIAQIVPRLGGTYGVGQCEGRV